MVRAEQKPGRRRAAPPPRRVRLPARRRPERQAESEEKDLRPFPTTRPVRRPRTKRILAVAAKVLWFALVLVGLAAVTLPWTPAAVPEDAPLAGAVTLTTLFTHGLAVRSGGRALVSGGLALVLSGAAAVSGNEILLAAAAVGTAVVASILAVLVTTPAAKFAAVVGEVSVAAAVAVAGALAVAAYEPEVSLERANYLVIGFSLLGALALVYRLGAGIHGLGRRGLVMIVIGVALLTVTLAYTAALGAWGSPGMIAAVDNAFATVEAVLGAVPRPIEVFLGFPALAWGVSTRARRRQGWWVCAFGAPGLSVVTLSLVGPGPGLLEPGLSVLYSFTLGMLLGYGIIRADLFLTGARGRRARQLEELAAHRPEPGRLEPLL